MQPLARSSQDRAPALSVAALRGRGRRSTAKIVSALAGATALGVLLDVLFAGAGLPLGLVAIMSAVVLAALLVWMWHQPVAGLYVLFAAAVAVTTYTNGAPPIYIGKILPFFDDLNTITHTKIVALSPADLFVVLAIAVWLLRSLADRNLHFDRGSLMLPLGLYMSMVLVAAVHGLTSGGDFTHTLWEMRIQVYMFVAYILACNLVRSRAHVMVLLWILIIGTGEIGIEGTFAYLFTIRPSHQMVNEIYSHEQAFFFNAFLTLTLVLLLYKSSAPRLKRAALIFLPFVIVASLANNRRTFVVAFGLALLVLLLITLVAYPARRRAAAWILLALAIGFPPYYLAFQHSSGTLGMPARAVASAFNPDARDASSDSYRVNEDKDIKANMRRSPVIGTGLGKPMQEVYPLPYIDKIYPLEPYLPHNSILWIWMRVGTLGYLFFWFLIGASIVQSIRLIRRYRDPWVKAIAIFICLMIIQEIIFGYLDMQWTINRNLIVVGTLFALISRLPALTSDNAGPDKKTRRRSEAAPKRTGMPTSPSLAVVDGRVRGGRV